MLALLVQFQRDTNMNVINVTTMAAETRGFIKRGVHPWFRRLHLALNYLPVVFGGILLILLAMVTVGVTNGLVALGASIVWVIAVEETIGRQPFVMREGSLITVRNIVRTYVVDTSEVKGSALYRFRLGKDTCPGIRTKSGQRTLPVLAYFGCEVEDLAGDVDI